MGRWICTNAWRTIRTAFESYFQPGYLNPPKISLSSRYDWISLWCTLYQPVSKIHVLLCLRSTREDRWIFSISIFFRFLDLQIRFQQGFILLLSFQYLFGLLVPPSFFTKSSFSTREEGLRNLQETCLGAKIMDWMMKDQMADSSSFLNFAIPSS